MLDIISIASMVGAIGTLAALTIIDLRVRLLPNTLVLALAVAGFSFHASTSFYYGDVWHLIFGAFIGGGSLYLIRMVGNFFYKADTLGLGDVKLMAAGGLWLGPHFILHALIAGALMGIVHGLVLLIHGKITTGAWHALSTFSLPAGPGFITGLLIAALAKFIGLPHLAFS